MYSEKTQSSSHYEADSDAEILEDKKASVRFPSKGREMIDMLEKEEEEIYEVEFDECSSSDEEIKKKVKSAERRGIAVRSSKNRTRYEINDGRYPKPPETSYFDDQQLPTQIFEKSFITSKNLLIGLFCLILLATVLGVLVSIFGFSKILVNSSHKSQYGYEVALGDKDVNITKLFDNSSIAISLSSNVCSYFYSCPETCTEELDRMTSCCDGCDQGPYGECGLNVTIRYYNIPKTNITSPPLIYLLASNDGVHFWQTGSPLFVQGYPNSGGGGISLGGTEYTNSSGKITNGCFGRPRSIAILGCLSFYNLTDVQFNTGIPEDTCLVLGGSCPRLNNVWQRSVVGCLGDIWVGSGLKLNYSLPVMLLGLIVSIVIIL